MEFFDEYNHEIPGVIYFPQNLPTKEVQDLYEYSLQGCDCEKKCEGDRCVCLQRSGTFYRYEDSEELKNYSIRIKGTSGPTYECNENCKCVGNLCGNRLVQFGPRKLLKVRQCADTVKGMGLFTLDKVHNGSFVCEYAGEIITQAEAFRRFKKNGEENRTNYIFCIKENFGETTRKTFIDPTHYGNIGRYINHSCQPNCRLFVVRINDTMPILGIFALQDIPENTEITYDYGDGERNFEKTDDHKYKTCCCNSKDCRKYLPFDLSLSS